MERKPYPRVDAKSVRGWYLSMDSDTMKGKEPKENSKRGRPITRKIEIHATAEEIAKAMFAAADPPDPSKRIVKRPRKG